MNHLKISFFICSVYFLFCQCGQITINDCGSLYEIVSVGVEGCKGIPCSIRKWTSQELTVTLKPSRHSSLYLNQTVQLFLREIDAKLAYSPGDPCQQINCPILESNKLLLTATLHLNKTELVPMSGHIKWTIMNDKNYQVMCFTVLVNLYP